MKISKKKKTYPECAPGIPAKFGGTEPNPGAQDSGPHLPIPQQPPLKHVEKERFEHLEHHIHGLDASITSLRGDVKRLRSDFGNVLKNLIASVQFRSEVGPAALFNIAEKHRGLDT